MRVIPVGAERDAELLIRWRDAQTRGSLEHPEWQRKVINDLDTGEKFTVVHWLLLTNEELNTSANQAVYKHLKNNLQFATWYTFSHLNNTLMIVF